MAILPIPSAVNLSNADIMLMQNEAIQEETHHLEVLKDQVDIYMSQYSTQKTLLIAVLAIAALLFFILFLILKAFWQRRKYQENLENQNRELAVQRDQLSELNTRLTEATQSKLRFFTNVSHDLRTPLTLISEPVEQLSSASNLTPGQHKLMNIAAKNVRILQRLINQILDFRKYENGMMDAVLTEVSPSPLLEEWVDSFRAVARKRDMDLKLKLNLPEDFSMALDVEKMERVVFNLVSNALKYTPDNGKISVNASVSENNFILSVSDTGRGIASEDLKFIFDNFFQVDKVHPNGSGIGLSLTKAFVELLGGTIGVSSTPGKGSEFTVSLPVRHCDTVADSCQLNRSVTNEEIELALSPVETEDGKFEREKPLALIIDDNDDIRTLLSELLHDSYNVLQASDGAEGIRLASKYIPDIVICDVMMPGMNGFECCRRIKEETSTSHIPVLMLTACAADEQRVSGYESGADGYLSKPFNNQVLLTRCKNLIDNRKIIHDLWVGKDADRKDTHVTPENASGDRDNEFYNRFLEIFREQMADPELNVDSLAASMGLGRSQFYRKIKALTNYSPVELVRKLRLKSARAMLTSSDRTVSEIAYAVGFSTPAYFTKCYREAYGETPSELRERLGK